MPFAEVVFACAPPEAAGYSERVVSRGTSSAFWENLRQPMPLGRKLRLFIANRMKFPPPPCCGHPGEPGC
jgi:hypothetical protein